MDFLESNVGGKEPPIILTEKDFVEPDRLFAEGGKLYSRLDDMPPFVAARIVQAHPELFRQYAPLIQEMSSIDYVFKLFDMIPTHAGVLCTLFQEAPKLIECYVAAAYAHPKAFESTEPPMQIR